MIKVKLRFSGMGIDFHTFKVSVVGEVFKTKTENILN